MLPNMEVVYDSDQKEYIKKLINICFYIHAEVVVTAFVDEVEVVAFVAVFWWMFKWSLLLLLWMTSTS